MIATSTSSTGRQPRAVRPARGWPAPTRMVAFVGVLLLAACTSAPPGPAPTTATVDHTVPAAGAMTASGPVRTPEVWAEARRAATESLVRARVAAAAAGDETQWLRPLRGDPLRVAQAEVLRRMVDMRLTAVRVSEIDETVAPVPAGPGQSVSWDAEATIAYRLRGFDRADRSARVSVTLAADPDRPEAAEITAWGPTDRPQPWDLPGLAVRRSSRALVLGVGSARDLDVIATRADQAAGEVAAVWGHAQPAVWIAPSSDEDAARLLGRTTADLQGVAAATDGPVEPGHPAGADRIVLVPRALQSLQSRGRLVVMTHELTHVTVRASTTRAVPLWLSEGFAEYVAYRRVELPERTIVAPALDAVRLGGVPTSLPSAVDFEPQTGALSVAYGRSLLAVRTLAELHGTDGLVGYYRAAAGGLRVATSVVGNVDAVSDLALRAVLHTDTSQLTARWQTRLERLVG